MNDSAYAAAFVSCLRNADIPFEVIRKSDDLMVLKLGSDMLEIDDSSCHFTRLLKPVSRSDYNSALETVNRLNQKYTYCQFNIMKVQPYYMCASYYFSLYGEADNVAVQILKMYRIFIKITRDIGGLK